MGYVSEIENIKIIEDELSDSNNHEKDIYLKTHLVNKQHSYS